MRILIVDNNIMPSCWGAADLRGYAASFPGATVYVRRGPADDLPKDLSRYDRIVISGSMTPATEQVPWVSRLDELIRRSVELGKPLLGVCYGHQSLARALGGPACVRRSETAEYGWTRIEQLAPSALLKGIPEVFYSFSAHFDEIAQLPAGMRVLARSAGCEIQACQLGDKPVFGVQFHPEKDLRDGEKTLEERRKKGTPKVLLHPNDGARLYDPKVATTLFGNFFQL